MRPVVLVPSRWAISRNNKPWKPVVNVVHDDFRGRPHQYSMVLGLAMALFPATIVVAAATPVTNVVAAATTVCSRLVNC
jgi:hypothetical protein